MRSRLALLAAVLLATLPAGAADTWKIDGSHTGVHFSVRHMMISNVRGDFTRVSGTVAWDPKNPAATALDITIDAASVDTGNEDRDKHLRAADFFETEKYPTIAFRSKKVESAGEGNLRITGDLAMHGVTKEVILNVEGLTPEIKDPWGNLRMGAAATTTLRRSDFGIGGKYPDAVIGDEIRVTIDVEVLRKPEPPAAEEKPAAK